ncbi:MAG: hypothetical protein JF888_14335 [Candidatus Dormibacteraeota bacterium]|uniref:Uncharacterized protein n=1 Tax=Candidatus Dormiibacter inghamiae TaxID=3127013 RepID=A0A934NI24_9BACT|nr:hypothetical protein [Candidatus Dormibacteraeota bacterium]MBJ7604799.1 hypothetical protein [Candidatus Dormibacteraeota bacterium]
MPLWLRRALAALSRCLGQEVGDDGVAVTNVHMPLVRVPMIAPTDIYADFPTIDTDQAAKMVLEAVLCRPLEVSTRLGKFGGGCRHCCARFAQAGHDRRLPRLPGVGRQIRGSRGEGGTGMSTEAAALAYLMRGVHF